MNKNKTKKAVKVKNRTLSFHEIWLKYQRITKNIAFSVAFDLFPITSSEIKGLKDILKVVEPFYQFPSEKQLYEVMIPQLYDQVKQKVLSTIKGDLLKGVKNIALTIDGWTGRSITDHMSLTVHYWTAEFEPRHFLLQLESLPRAWNTAQDLFHLIQNVLLKYGFGEGEAGVHIVSANGQNAVGAVAMSEKWTRVPCFARLLQQTVDDVLQSCFEDFDGLVAKCRHVVGALWSRSAPEPGEPGSPARSSSILRDSVPSWSSLFDMLDSLLRLRKTLSAFLQEAPALAGRLTEADWEAIRRYVALFSPAKQASELLAREASPYPPLSLYLPSVRAILELLGSADQPGSRAAAQLLARALCSRFAHVNTNESMIAAMVLDPRFKVRLLADDEKCAVFHVVKSKMVASLAPSSSQPTSSNEAMKIDAESPFEFYFSSIVKRDKCAEEYADKMSEAELTYYLCENVAPMDTRVHEWWRANASRFPRLAELAKMYLSVPAVQVSLERAFPNKQGFLIDKRAELLANQVNVLDLMRISFLNHNLSQFKADINL